MPELRTGFTTGACASAAAKAATRLLLFGVSDMAVDIPMPRGGRAGFVMEELRMTGRSAFASIKKDAGDDPDVTNGMTVSVTVEKSNNDGITFIAGDGVGTVTRPGLQIPPGQPAINPGPRAMITAALREVTDASLCVTVAIPGGEQTAQRTFNPRLGIEGGLSILGTTGIVRPYSHEAIKETLKCELDVALAGGITVPVLTAGNIGTKAALETLGLWADKVIEVGNEWGFMASLLRERGLQSLCMVGHPGKLAKLANGEFDTHSSRSQSAVPFVLAVAKEVLGHGPETANTVEEIFKELPAQEAFIVGNCLAQKIATTMTDRTGAQVSVFLINMAGYVIGSYGEVENG